MNVAKLASSTDTQYVVNLQFLMEKVNKQTLKASIPIIRVSQTCLTLTNFIEKSINMYNIK